MTIQNNCCSGRAMEAAQPLRNDTGPVPGYPSTSGVAEAGDDRYPGTFFRVPGVPVPGKTAWNLVK